MDRSKIVAVVTGAIAIALSLAYLLLVQLLDFRGEMIPAPLSEMIPAPRSHGESAAAWGPGSPRTGAFSPAPEPSPLIHTASTSV